MFTTKSDYARDFMQKNPEIAKLHRWEIAKHLHAFDSKVFQSVKHADAVLQNVEKYNSRQTQGVDTRPSGTPVKPTNGSVALSETQLRAMFDIRQIVKDELDKIPEGEFWKDSDFTRRFQGKAGYRSMLESPEAMPYRGKASGQVFWGHPKSINKLKSEGVLL